MDRKPITIATTINAPLEKVWEYWNSPEHITKWAFADDTWEAPHAENDIRTGGKFSTIMAAKDKSASFDFTGVYTNVKDHEVIEYDMEKAPTDEKPRHVTVTFEQTNEGVKVTQTFDQENENPEEMQRAGWQAILENFKKHVESN